MSRNLSRWTAVVLVAVAMAWMEAATVVYLRTLVGRLVPYQADPLPLDWRLGGTELVREGATLIMLLGLACLAGWDPRTRFAFWALAFGIWDLFYYVFLALIGPWPRSVWDWDVLFLIPLPWWGPVAAPSAIALLMVAGGSLVALGSRPGAPRWPSAPTWCLSYLGAALALTAFMWDALWALPRGFEAVRTGVPAHFPWWLFLPAWVLMSLPVAELLRQGCDPGAGSCRSGDHHGSSQRRKAPDERSRASVRSSPYRATSALCTWPGDRPGCSDCRRAH